MCPSPAKIDLFESTCPFCRQKVRSFWVDGGGMLSRPSITLVADCIYHSECWDKLVEENPHD